MPAPTTADELLELVIKSKLVEEPRLRTYVQKLGETTTVPTDPAKLAQFLVRDAMLTYFQAEQLLQGKYKRFSLGKYKVLERLGSGGMGTVFLCEHKLMRRRVAVKVLPFQKAEDKASLDRFMREARAIAAVDHPNIVRAYDLDQDDNLHFLVMEWVDGTNLQDLVKKFGPLDPVRACHYVYGAAVGLQHAHEIGLIHRDIKPGNILIDRSGVVKILDLGLARLTHDQEDNLTRQNDENVLGTADYLAPEQAMDSHTVDIRADIYSLGATFYFLLTGSAPFPEGSVAQKLIWHQNRAPRSIKVLRAEVPEAIVAIVEKMMAKDANKRYRTPSEVIAALTGWVTQPIPPPADREMPTLSPAVAGSMGASRGQMSTPSSTGGPALVGGSVRTMPAASSTTFSGMPTAIVAGTVTTPAPVTTTPAPPPAPAAEPAVWSTLDADTQSVARAVTKKSTPTEDEDEDEAPKNKEKKASSRVGRRTPAESNPKVKLALFALAGIVLFIVTVGGGWLLYAKYVKTAETPPTPPTQSSRKIIVSRAGGENAVNTLRQAIDIAQPGYTIVIQEPRLSEAALKLDRYKHKDLVIESATPDGKPAVIEYIGTKNGVMLDAQNIDGLHVRNVEFDGRGNAEIAVQLGFIMPGATFENVTVRNVAKRGFYLWNVTGVPDRPLVFDRVRVVLTPTTEAGVMSLASGNPPLDNRYIAIKNSRFEGQGGGTGIRIDGPTSDFDVTNNRFFSLGAAVSFLRPSGKASKGTFTNNTIYGTGTALQFESPVAEGQYHYKVAQNYFAQTTVLLRANGAVPGLTSENNLYDTDPQSGYPPEVPANTSSIKATKQVVALPNLNPDDDATFLRFPAGASPTTGPTRLRVGAHER
jgi:serine/threonine protein kinase